jgi:hypothetical protein
MHYSIPLQNTKLKIFVLIFNKVNLNNYNVTYNVFFLIFFSDLKITLKKYLKNINRFKNNEFCSIKDLPCIQLYSYPTIKFNNKL